MRRPQFQSFLFVPMEAVRHLVFDIFSSQAFYSGGAATVKYMDFLYDADQYYLVLEFLMAVILPHLKNWAKNLIVYSSLINDPMNGVHLVCIAKFHTKCHW